MLHFYPQMEKSETTNFNVQKSIEKPASSRIAEKGPYKNEEIRGIYKGAYFCEIKKVRNPKKQLFKIGDLLKTTKKQRKAIPFC